MGFLKILLEAVVRFVQICATAIGTLFSSLSGRPSIPSGQGMLRGGKRNLVAVACIVVIVVSIGRLLMTLVGSSQKVDLDPYELLGKVCAEELTKLLGGRGQVVVIAWDTSRHKLPAVEAEVGSFRKTLGKAGLVSIRATESLGGSSPMMMEGLTPAKLKAIIERYPGVEAIVSFVGVPALNSEEIEQWPPKAPKLVLVGPSDPAGKLKTLLDAKVVELAILPRLEPVTAPAKKPETERERFDQNYQILTSAPTAKLP
jgi:hypothetical protein